MLTIVRNDTMHTKVIANESFHIPVEDIDAAERIGVLVAMDWFRSNMVEIFEKIANVHAVLQLPIAMHFDRSCLVETLPQCEAFNFLRASLVVFVCDFLREKVDFLRENLVDQLDQDKCGSPLGTTELWRISQHQQKPEQSDTPQEKPATWMSSSIEFVDIDLDALD